MTGADYPDDEPFRPPLPPEDRLWRHPAEMAAALRAPVASTIAVSTLRTPVRQAVGLATLGALGGALVVTGLFLTLGGSATPAPTSNRVVETLVVNPIMPIAQVIPASAWPGAVAEGAAPGVATVVADGPDGEVTGSGVVFRSDGYLLTSYDLLEGATSVEVITRSGDRYEGTIVGSDSISGLGVVHIDVPDVNTAHLAIVVPPPQVGDYAVGLTGSDDVELEMGTVSAVNVNAPVSENQRLHGLLQLTSPTPEGGSGGAVLDDTGSVVGIIVDVGTQNSLYAVPIGYARKIAEDLIETGHADHSWLGIRGVDLPENQQNQYGVDGAVRIQSVITDSPAHRAGLQKGDLITAVDGEPVASMTELILQLRRNPPGDKVEITALVDGARRRLPVELANRLVEDTT